MSQARELGCSVAKGASRRITMHTTSRVAAHDPDGVPHEIVGLTWVFAIGAAISVFAALNARGSLAALLFVLLPLAIVAVDRSARRKRGADGSAGDR
jgi:hypothetical protein